MCSPVWSDVIFFCFFSVNDPVAAKLLRKAGEMPSLVAPEDMSIKTLYVGGLDARVSDEDLKDQFYSFGEIESIRMVPQRACAFVTYTSREGAEKAADNMANKLVIKGLRLKLMWGRPQVAKGELEAGDKDDGKSSMGSGILSHAGMLPRAIISQQQQHQQVPGQEQAPHNYFNLPPPSQSTERPFYPSMDPQRMGAVVSGGQESSSSEQGEGSNVEQRPQPGQFGGQPIGQPPYGYSQQGPPPHFQHFRGPPPPFPPGGPPPPHSYQPYPPPHFQPGPPGPPGPPPQFFRPQY